MNLNMWRGLDLETQGEEPMYGLQPHRSIQNRARISAISIADDDNMLGQLYPGIEFMRKILSGCAQNKLPIVGWNVAFDASWLIAAGLEEEVFSCQWLDGMLLWKHLTIEPTDEFTPAAKRKSYSLEAAMHEFFPGEGDFKEFDDFDAEDEESLKQLLNRNKKDAWYTLKLAKKFYLELTDRQRVAALIESRSIPQFARTAVAGLCADERQVDMLDNQLAVQRQETYDELLRENPEVADYSLDSPKQLGKLLFNQWGLPILKTSKKTGEPSTDKETLYELAPLDPRAGAVRTIREAKNNRTKFVTAIKKSLEYNEDSRVRPSPRIFGTYCVPGTVEVLTPSGWVALKDWTGGDILQINPLDQSGCFLPASRYVGPLVDEWVHATPLRCDFTYGHTVPYLAQKTNNWSTKQAGEMIINHPNSQFTIPVALNRFRTFKTNRSDLEMRILAMAQADGWFSERGFLKFTFIKDRKISRCCELLVAAGVEHRVRSWPSYPDRCEIIIPKRGVPNWLDRGCKHLGSWLLDNSAESLESFLDELTHWDGSPHPDGGVNYSTNIKENADWVVTIAHLCGRKASVHAVGKDGVYRAHLSDKSVIRPVRTVRPALHMKEVTKNQRAYCATTKTGFWLARSNGRIFATGNTGRVTYNSTMKDRKSKPQVEYQTGFAIHQTKRDACFRKCIIPPEGYTLLELDAAGQEFRWMAVASQDETMLGLCAPGEDAHSYMGSQVAQREYRELQRLAAEGDKQAKNDRNLGKFCIAEGEMVLTDKGLVPIQYITLAHRVWDGVEWVSHDGLEYQGEAEVINYEGLTATPTHRVYLDNGDTCWIETAAAEGYCIAKTGSGRQEIRVMDSGRFRDPAAWQGDTGSGEVRLRNREVGVPTELIERKVERVQKLRIEEASCIERSTVNHQCCDASGAEEVFSYGSTVPESKRSIVSQLWRPRDSIQVRQCERGHSLCTDGTAARDISSRGHRPDRQRRSLREGEFASGYTQREPRKQIKKVYDILNAGPRHRFTVSNYLVCNSNLSFQYRIGSKSATSKARVQYQLNVEEPFIKNILNIYESTYPGVPRYWRNQIQICRSQMYAETVAGRRVALGGWNRNNRWQKESTAINYPIQGTGADQKYLALAVARNELPQFGGHIYFELHDGIFFIIPTHKIKQAAAHLRDKLSALPYKQAWGVDLPILFPFDAKIGPSWGELENFEG